MKTLVFVILAVLAGSFLSTVAERVQTAPSAAAIAPESAATRDDGRSAGAAKDARTARREGRGHE